MNKDTVIIIAASAILNPKEIKPYDNISVNYSVYLNTLLYSNWLEIFKNTGEQYQIIALLSEIDREFFPKYFIPPEIQQIFYKETPLKNLTDFLNNQSSVINSKTLVLFYNSMGIKQSDISRVFNLNQIEESSLIIGKSVRGNIVFACTYGLDKDIFDPLLIINRKYDEYLSLISSKDIFIHTLDNFLSIDDFEDIKKLYIELSKKESLSYCSQNMHESFNDLFIEYKELLNV